MDKELEVELGIINMESVSNNNVHENELRGTSSSYANSVEDEALLFKWVSSGSSSSTRESVVNSVEDEALLFKSVMKGDTEMMSSLEINLNEFRFNQDRSCVLHVAASAGQAQLITNHILPNYPHMIELENSKGDLPFHSAVKAGNLHALKALTHHHHHHHHHHDFVSRKDHLLLKANNNGDTPLHIAVINNQQDMARHLVNEDVEACYQLNKQKISPLYLAIKARYWQLVKHMLASMKKVKPPSECDLLKGKSVVHAAIEAQEIEILKEILENYKDLIKSVDEQGRTPLSYAAFKGYVEGVDYLLQNFLNWTFMRDNDGSFAIHKAASGGHIKVIQKLGSMKWLLNNKGQSILHVAAGAGKSDLVSYLLKIQEFEVMINLKDEDGKTPLHLATKGFHPRVVYILTRDKRVDLYSQNREGLTALDVAEIHAEKPFTFEERLTWLALRYVDAPRGSLENRKECYKKMCSTNDMTTETKKEDKKKKLKGYNRTMQKTKENGKNKLEGYKDRIDTLLVVATLVATMTFAAGFTLPGGYNQSEPGIGMATLPHKRAFQGFVICDTAAMYSSILVVVTLIWAQLGELKLMLVALRFTVPVLGLSLTSMSVAFMLGLFVVLRNIPWLSYVVLGIGAFFLPVILLCLIPLYNPSKIRNPVKRFFFSAVLRLLLVLSEKAKVSKLSD